MGDLSLAMLVRIAYVDAYDSTPLFKSTWGTFTKSFQNSKTKFRDVFNDKGRKNRSPKEMLQSGVNYFN